MTGVKCPDCRWYLRFVAYPEAYEHNALDLWEALCRNPNCVRGSQSDPWRRTVKPSEAVS